MAEKGRMVQMWFRKSKEDLLAAKLLLTKEDENLFGPVVFHAQQSAEKAIKGYLAFHKIRFPKTHDMEILILLVGKHDTALSQELEPAKILTEYAVAYRYPEEKEPPEPLTQKTVKKF